MDLRQRDDSTDRILRLALLACACDRRSALTKVQRKTIVELGKQEAGVSPEIILALGAPLLMWCKDIRPSLAPIVQEQMDLLEREHRMPTTGELKPIETMYNGYRFRSRLEARWALFFDTMGWGYHYEPQGFVLPHGLPYLPDFYLPRFNTYVEIKGQAPTEDEREIALQCGRSNRPYCLLYGPCAGGGAHGVLLVTGGVTESPQAMFAGCRSCGEGVWLRGHDFATPLEPCPDPCFCDKWPLPTKAMDLAYAAAQQARFEHGETPRALQQGR